MKQKPTDTANDKLLICLGIVLIIKLKVYIAKIDKNCFPFFFYICQKSDVSPLQKKYDQVILASLFLIYLQMLS